MVLQQNLISMVQKQRTQNLSATLQLYANCITFWPIVAYNDHRSNFWTKVNHRPAIFPNLYVSQVSDYCSFGTEYCGAVYLYLYRQFKVCHLLYRSGRFLLKCILTEFLFLQQKSIMLFCGGGRQG